MTEDTSTHPTGTYASLLSCPATKEAHALVNILMGMVLIHEQAIGERKNERGKKKLAELKEAIGAFTGDLVRALTLKHAENAVYRSVKATAFTDEPISYRTFRTITKAFEALGLIESFKGKQFFTRNHFDPSARPFASGGHSTRFKATEKFMQICEEASVAPAQFRTHFTQKLPDFPIALRSSSKRMRGEKIKGQKIRVERNEQTLSLANEIKEINAFLVRFDLEPIPFSGFKRQFNEGDSKDFNWNKGGRLYCQGSHNYQTQKSDARLQMTVDGEAVVELDIRASYLTILHGHLRKDFDVNNDPYEIEGLDRVIVKAWTVATLGSDKHIKKWPTRASKEYEELYGKKPSSIASVEKIRVAMVSKHPALNKWGEQDFGWADLMFFESEAIIKAMKALMARGIPSYPIHDSLIVRERDELAAIEALKASYFTFNGIEPAIGIRRA
jgi:hypothetical protein